MKPNLLVMQAFGPFAKTHTIHFDQLGNHPLFLINGPTGSGKSSILDAICFALYGQTTGKEREAMQMRCDHAPDTLLTEITLEFTFRDARYRIVRSPTQIRAKTRGEGTTEHKTTARLWKLSEAAIDEQYKQSLTTNTQYPSDDAIIELTEENAQLMVSKSAKEATDAIVELTGLNVEQFRQVMVLPQGKFRDFLLADSSQREAIFSQLFQTDIYQRIENRLKKKASAIRHDLEGLENQVKGLLQGADVSSEEELEASLSELENRLKQANTQKSSADQALTKAQSTFEQANRLLNDFQLLEKDQQQHKSLLAQQSNIIVKEEQLNLALSAEKMLPLHKELQKNITEKQTLEQQLNKLEKQCEQKKQAVIKAKHQLEDAEKEAQSLDQLKAQTADLKKLLPKLSGLEQASQIRIDTEKQYAQVEQNIKKQENRIAKLKQSIESDEKQISQLNESTSTLVNKQRTLDNLSVIGKQKADLDLAIKKQTTLTKSLNQETESLTQLHKQIKKQETLTQTLTLSWHSNQAALLAAKLKHNEACPVCGSLDHPIPATTNSQNQVTTKEAVETANNQLIAFKEKAAGIESKMQELNTQLDDIQQDIEKRRQSLGAEQHKSTVQLRQEWKQLDAEVKNIKNQEKQIKEITQSVSQQKTTLQNQENALQSLRQQTQKHLEASVLATHNEQRLLEELPEAYRQPNALNQQINELEQSIQTITHHQQQALQRLQSAEKQATESKATLAQLQKQYSQTISHADQTKQQWQKTLVSSAFNDEDNFLSSILDEAQQSQIHHTIQQFKESLNACHTRIEQQQQRLANKQKPDIDTLQNHLATLTTKAAEALNHWKDINSRYDKQKDTQTKLKAVHDNNQQLEHEYAIYGTLSEVANGQRGNKVSLQRFVISVFLDDVLIEASHRLHIMSKKRYRLIRKQERAKGNKASGLELEVEDAYTGKTRPVSTLSGGESFMAALSLALGLSDRVQSYAGGIKLDTLFIDEGFGSLDQESLDSAIKTLIDLQSSGRMIGIISHVSELREQMKLRVDVKSSPSGSSVCLHG